MSSVLLIRRADLVAALVSVTLKLRKRSPLQKIYFLKIIDSFQKKKNKKINLNG